jgi:hypothetical protein
MTRSKPTTAHPRSYPPFILFYSIRCKMQMLCRGLMQMLCRGLMQMLCRGLMQMLCRGLMQMLANHSAAVMSVAEILVDYNRRCCALFYCARVPSAAVTVFCNSIATLRQSKIQSFRSAMNLTHMCSTSSYNTSSSTSCSTLCIIQHIRHWSNTSRNRCD